VEQYLDSTLDSVDRAEELVLGVAKRAGFGEEELMKIGMAVRESMVNAVAHGNRYNRNKKVRFRVQRNGTKLTVRITDEGEGFDFGNLPDPVAPENLLRGSGRGIFLIRSFMDEVQLRQLDPGGTEITLTKYVTSQ